jgi:hypothetical protein
VAQDLGLAMLGGWVRNSLEREQVAQQLHVMSPQQRATAMQYALSLQTLPYPTSDHGWPLSQLEPSSIFQLGVSCMAALLTDESSGSKERFAMRFPRALVVPLELSDAQRQEALHLVREHTRISSITPGTTGLPKQEANT